MIPLKIQILPSFIDSFSCKRNCEIHKTRSVQSFSISIPLKHSYVQFHFKLQNGKYMGLEIQDESKVLDFNTKKELENLKIFDFIA